VRLIEIHGFFEGYFTDWQPSLLDWQPSLQDGKHMLLDWQPS